MRTDRLWLGPKNVAPPYGPAARVAFVVGGLLIIWSGYLHFHLWLDVGYRHIPTIGPLFILQAVTGLMIGLMVMGVQRVWAGVTGAGFALSTLAGFLISVEHGLFGFKDSWSSPFVDQALAIEIASIVVLAAGTLLCWLGDEHPADRNLLRL